MITELNYSEKGEAIMRELKKQNNVVFSCYNHRKTITTSNQYNEHETGLKSIPPMNADKTICFKNSDGEIIGLTNDELSRKVLLIGDSGEGKSNTFYQLFEQVSDLPGSVNIIFDSKGDFYERYGGKDDDCVIEGFSYNTGNRGIDFGDCLRNSVNKKKTVKKWNLFDEILLDDNPDSISRELAKTLNGKNTNENRQFFFKEAVVSVIETGINVLRNDYYVKGIKPNNRLLVDYLRSTPELMLQRAKEYNLDNRISNLISPAKDGVYNGQTLGVMGEVNNIVSDLFVGNFAQAGDFSIRNAIRNQQFKNIYIEYDITYGKTLSPIYSCLIMLAIKEALGRFKTPKVNLFIDEFALLEYIPDMEAAVSFGREQGLFIAASIQHIGQVRSKYTKELADGMLNNFRNLIAFRSSDYETREFIKNRFGQKHMQHTFYRSLNERITLNNMETVVSDENVLLLKKGEAIISTADSDFCYKFRFKNIKDGENNE